MRKFANVKSDESLTKRIIVYETNTGTYVFPCATLEDGSATGDYWFENLIQADEFYLDYYSINDDDWQLANDPQEGCQHDWLAPVRVKADINSTSIKMERFENNQWIEFDHPRATKTSSF